MIRAEYTGNGFRVRRHGFQTLFVLFAAGLPLTAQPAPRISPNGITNAASFLAGPIAPGELITIFGSNLGPEQLITLQLTPDRALVTKSLAGVQVLFDDVPAPLIHVSSKQLSAVVPFGVARKSAASVQVEYNGLRSEPVQVEVVPASPGIFSMDSSGKGLGAILNQNGHLNGPANFAAPASVVVLYATGAGLMSNLPSDGAVAGLDFSFPMLPVAAFLNNEPAQVLYAGAAPGLVHGVIQVNVRLPDSLPTGAAAIRIVVGNVSSQPDLLVSTGLRAPMAKGARVLGIDVNMAEKQTYRDAVTTAQKAGSRAVSLSLNWDDIEKESGVYNNELLRAQNLFLRGTATFLSLRIRPVDTNGLHLPSDLRGRSLADPAVASRFEALMDFVSGELPDATLISVAIGNEVDIAFGLDAAAWNDYKVFYDSVLSYLKARHPALKFGVAISYQGLTSYAREWSRALNENSDVIMVNDYPIAPNYSVEDPAAVRVHFDQLARLYPGRTIHFTEIGYPSSPTNSSSDQKQRTFVEEVFRAWDAHAAAVEYLSVVWLTDLPQERVDQFREYYAIDAAGFLEFLRTLGLRTYAGTGTDKPAYRALREQAGVRGWPIQ